MGVMQNNLLLGNITVAAGYVPVARDVSAIRTSAGENSFTGSSFKEDIPATVTRKRMLNIRFTENRLLATKSYPAVTEIDVIMHKCHWLSSQFSSIRTKVFLATDDGAGRRNV